MNGNLHSLDKYRGHCLVPTIDELATIPLLYATDGQAFDSKTVRLRYFAGGRAEWLITELDPDSWLMFGWCDLGLGLAEWGYVDLHELAELCVHTPQGLPVYVERDLAFEPTPFGALAEGRL